MNINDVVALFWKDGHYTKEDTHLEEVVQDFARNIGINDWNKFKNSSRKRRFYSKKIGRYITILGDKSNASLDYGWLAKEIEYSFEKKLKTSELDIIDKVKKTFMAEIVL